MPEPTFYTHEDGSIGVSTGDGYVIHPSGLIKRIDAQWSRTANLCEDDLSSEAIVVLLTKSRLKNIIETDKKLTKTLLDLIKIVRNWK